MLINRCQSDFFFYFRPEFKACPTPGLWEFEVFLPWHWRASACWENSWTLRAATNEWMNESVWAILLILLPLHRNTAQCSCLCFSPDLAQLITKNHGRRVFCFSCTSRLQLRILHAYGNIYSERFHSFFMYCRPNERQRPKVPLYNLRLCLCQETGLHWKKG